MQEKLTQGALVNEKRKVAFFSFLVFQYKEGKNKKESSLLPVSQHIGGQSIKNVSRSGIIKVRISEGDASDVDGS